MPFPRFVPARPALLLILVALLPASPGIAQRLQTLRPDGSVFESVVVGQYVAVALPDRFGQTARYAGRVSALGPDSLTMMIYGRSQAIAIREIRGLRRISRFGASVRRAGRFIVAGAVGVTGDVVGSLTQERTVGARLLASVGSTVAVGALALFLIRQPPLRKLKNGYSFRVER